jgi:hypothetical protein
MEDKSPPRGPAGPLTAHRYTGDLITGRDAHEARRRRRGSAWILAGVASPKCSSTTQAILHFQFKTVPIEYCVLRIAYCTYTV